MKAFCPTTVRDDLVFSISEVLLAENSTQIPPKQRFPRRKPNSKPKSPPKFIKALENRIKIWYTVLCTKNLPVAQLDSASDSDSEGQRFESVRVGQKVKEGGLAPFFNFLNYPNVNENRSPQSLAIVRMGSESSASTRTCFPKFAPQNFAFDILQCAYDNLLPLLNSPNTPPAILPSSSSPRAL